MTKSKPLPPVDQVRKLLSYDPKAGDFSWNQSIGRRYKCGDSAGGINAKGYRVVFLNKKQYRCHRLAWLLMTGQDPGGYQIDHINGNKSDNRWENLRLATNSQNRLNAKRPTSNTSGAKGVRWCAKDRCWFARVALNGRNVLYRRFRSFDDACDAATWARDTHHKEFARHV